MAFITFQPKDHFNTVAWTGTSSSPLNVTGYGFQPDWVWNKYRAGAGDHQVYDAVRGATKMLIPNSSNAESTNANGVTAFITDGFTAGSDINVNGGNSVAWGWKANGQGSANTDGTINTTYTSVNTTAGLSIIKYTGSGSTGTVGHGLGVAPDLTIRKKLNSSDDWYVHTTLIDGSLDFLRLNTTATKSDSSLTGFTSSTIGVDASSYEEIIYAFKQITGFSKFGSYTGNGNADGAFIYTGFKPALVVAKRHDSGSEDWNVWDNKRIGYNVSGNDKLYWNKNSAESTGSDEIDILSNGFKWRTTNGGLNASGGSYLFMAFAEEPLVSSNNIPATAR